MTGDRLRVAVLGASGYVGQHFLRLLADHPRFEPVVLGAGPRSEGRRLEEVWQIPESPPPFPASRLERTSPARIQRQGVRLVFSALPSGTAARFEQELLRRGLHVFSNASDLRRDPRGCLLVPEINGERLRESPRAPLLVTNPNCTAAGLALALRPVLALLHPAEIQMTSYQARSGAGIPGLSSLAITDNVIPFISGEEEKVEFETGELLSPMFGDPGGTRVPVIANCARVPVRDGHLEAVTIRAGRTPRVSELRTAWSTFDPLRGFDCPTAPHPPIVLRAEEDRPQPRKDRWAGAPVRSKGMAVTVGRIRWKPPFLRFYALSHNAVRGAAGGSVLNAEWAGALGLLRGGR